MPGMGLQSQYRKKGFEFQMHSYQHFMDALSKTLGQ